MIVKQTIPSSNYDKSRKPIDRIVIHWIVGTLASADSSFKNPSRGASAHYGIEDDIIYQWVDEAHTAYHCGNYAYNQRSIGIEHSASPQRPASEETYQTSGKLIADICKRYNIPIDRAHIVKHSEVSATQCCGTIDIDKLIKIAKGGVDVDLQKELDKVRAERDTNWNLYQGQIKRTEEIQKELNIVSNQLIVNVTEITDLESKLKACENKPVPITEDTKLIQDLRTILKKILGI